MPKGEHFRRLSPETVMSIKTSSDKTKTLADRHGVSPRHVRQLRAGTSWKFLNIRF